MRQISEADITNEVLKRHDGTPDPRLKQLMQGLVKHLHAFIREVEPTEAEWLKAIEFLTATGQICTDKRQEFILLSDTLGVSMLVDLINHRKPAGATESTVLGPFYAHGAPELPPGGNIAPGDPGIPCVVSGRVLDLEGKPIAGALLDVWQTGSDALYDVQKPESEAAPVRGRFRTDAEGRYSFRTVRPVTYSIPQDGPVGTMLRATDRPFYRPAHIHFLVAAPQFETVTTHIFDAADPQLDADPVFAVKDSLVSEFRRHDVADRDVGVAPPFYSLDQDFVLKPSDGGATGPAWGAQR